MADIKRGLLTGLVSGIIMGVLVALIVSFLSVLSATNGSNVNFMNVIKINILSIILYSLFLFLPLGITLATMVCLPAGMLFSLLDERLPSLNSRIRGIICGVLFSIIPLPLLIFIFHTPQLSSGAFVVILSCSVIGGLVLARVWDNPRKTKSKWRDYSIIIIPIVCAILTFFVLGFLSCGLCPSKVLPEKCAFPASLTCMDHSVTANSIILALQNGAGRDMTITKISASSDALGTSVNLGCGCSTGAMATQVGTGQSSTFTLSTPDAAAVCKARGANYCTSRDRGRDNNRYNLTVFYYWTGAPSESHQLPGELLARKP